MVKLDIWTSKEKIKKELSERFSDAKQNRKWLESLWEDCIAAVYKNKTGVWDGMDVRQTISNDRLFTRDSEDDSDSPEAYVNNIMKNLRYTHSQFSANPPIVIPRPTSSDPEDKRRSDAADRCIRYGVRQYKLQELKDRTIWQCLVLGTAYMKGVWDSSLGDILEFDEKSGELEMDGDFAASNPATWDVYPDPHASTWESVRFVFEEIQMPFEAAYHMFGEAAAEKIKQSLSNKGERSQLNNDSSKLVSVLQYWEKGLPYNGYQGRFCWCLSDGTPLTDVVANPNGALQTLASGKKVRKAALPYYPITEIDMLDTYWGIPLCSYSIALQDEMSAIDTVTLDAMRAMGVARIMLPEGSEIAAGSITNTPMDIIKYKGNIPPIANLTTQPVSPVMLTMRDRMSDAIDDTHGINEAMRGQSSQRTSGYAMQFSVSQGNTIRQRFFTKYVGMIEDFYRGYLQILQEHWTTPKTIKVIGKEKAIEVLDIKGADLSAGYDLVPEYGATLPLDPMARQAMMVQYLPLFKEAGMPAAKILSLFKFAEIGEVFDTLELAADRQREVFEKMVRMLVYIKPDELQDHKGMLAWASTYVMTSEFRDLNPVAQQLIREHMKAREALIVQDASNPEGATPQAAEQPAQAAPQEAAPENLAAVLGM